MNNTWFKSRGLKIFNYQNIAISNIEDNMKKEKVGLKNALNTWSKLLI